MKTILSTCRDQWPHRIDERPDASAERHAPTPIIDSPCPPRRPAPTRCRRKAHTGFTLIEMLVAMSVAGVLSSVAYPSFTGQLQKTRRTDAMVSIMQVQMAEERLRGNSGNFGSLGQIGLPATSTSGFYALQVTPYGDDGYRILATATGAQSGDSACRHLQLTVDGANVAQASGPDANVANASAANRQCWNL